MTSPKGAEHVEVNPSDPSTCHDVTAGINVRLYDIAHVKKPVSLSILWVLKDVSHGIGGPKVILKSQFCQLAPS